MGRIGISCICAGTVWICMSSSSDPYISEIPEGRREGGRSFRTAAPRRRRDYPLSAHRRRASSSTAAPRADEAHRAAHQLRPRPHRGRSCAPSRRWENGRCGAGLDVTTPGRSRQTARSLSCRTSLSRRTTRPQRSSPPRAFPRSQPKTSMRCLPVKSRWAASSEQD